MSASLQPQLVTLTVTVQVAVPGRAPEIEAQRFLEHRLQPSDPFDTRLQVKGSPMATHRGLRTEEEAIRWGFADEWRAWRDSLHQPAEDPAQRQLFKDPTP